MVGKGQIVCLVTLFLEVVNNHRRMIHCTFEIFLVYLVIFPFESSLKPMVMLFKKYWTRSCWGWCVSLCSQASGISGMWITQAAREILLNSGMGVRTVCHCCSHWEYGADFLSCRCMGSRNASGITSTWTKDKPDYLSYLCYTVNCIEFCA